MQNTERLLLTHFKLWIFFKCSMISTSACAGVYVWAEEQWAGCITDCTDSGKRPLSCRGGFPKSGLTVPSAFWGCVSQTLLLSCSKITLPTMGFSLAILLRMQFLLEWRFFWICKLKFTTLEIAGICKLQWKINKCFIQDNGVHTTGCVSVIWDFPSGLTYVRRKFYHNIFCLRWFILDICLSTREVFIKASKLRKVKLLCL